MKDTYQYDNACGTEDPTNTTMSPVVEDVDESTGAVENSPSHAPSEVPSWEYSTKINSPSDVLSEVTSRDTDATIN